MSKEEMPNSPRGHSGGGTGNMIRDQSKSPELEFSSDISVDIFAR